MGLFSVDRVNLENLDGCVDTRDLVGWECVLVI